MPTPERRDIAAAAGHQVDRDGAIYFKDGDKVIRLPVTNGACRITVAGEGGARSSMVIRAAEVHAIAFGEETTLKPTPAPAPHEPEGPPPERAASAATAESDPDAARAKAKKKSRNNRD